MPNDEGSDDKHLAPLKPFVYAYPGRFCGSASKALLRTGVKVPAQLRGNVGEARGVVATKRDECVHAKLGLCMWNAADG
jgi:hypothetical protein